MSDLSINSSDLTYNDFEIIESSSKPFLKGRLLNASLNNALYPLEGKVAIVHELYIACSALKIDNVWKNSIREKIQEAFDNGQDKVFIPMTLKKRPLTGNLNNHIVLTILNIKNRTITYYDPRGTKLDSETRQVRISTEKEGKTISARRFVKILQNTLNETNDIRWTTKTNTTQHQSFTDTKNCGVFVYQMIQEVSKKSFEKSIQTISEGIKNGQYTSYINQIRQEISDLQ